MGCDNMLFVITVTCMLHTVKKSSNCKFIVHSPFSSKHNSTNIKRLTAWDPSQTPVKSRGLLQQCLMRLPQNRRRHLNAGSRGSFKMELDT